MFGKLMIIFIIVFKRYPSTFF